jgi:hypothetical protein
VPNSFLVEQSRDNYPVFWVDARAFDRAWRDFGDPSLFVGTWQGSPAEDWFRYRNGARTLIAPDVSWSSWSTERAKLGRYFPLGFTNGRHRTRWLIQNFARIPLGLYASDDFLAIVDAEPAGSSVP